jgi:hypothetical protein
MNRLAITLAALGLSGSAFCQSPEVRVEARPEARPRLRASAGDVARHLRLVPGDNARMIDAGGIRRFEANAVMPLADELLVVQPDAERAVVAESKKFTTLPFKLQLVDTATLTTRELWPVIHPVREVLEFDGTAHAFVGEVLIGLVDKNGVTSTIALPEVLTLQLVTSLGAAVPNSVKISHAGPPFASVALKVADDVPDMRLKILWGLETDDHIERVFPLRKPKVEVSVNPSRIAGFGLAVADITVHAPGAAARNVKTAIVSHDRGRLEGTQQVVLDDQGMGIAHLRSVGVGTAKVRVTVPTYEPGEHDVSFHWPIAFLVAAILGGLVGGVVRYVKGGRRRVNQALLRSALIGLVVAVGSAVGVNLLGIELTTGIGEGFVFVVAVLGALRGIKISGTEPATGAAG